MKICPNCIYGNSDKDDLCSKCGASLWVAPIVKWNDFRKVKEIQEELKANTEVYGKFVKPSKKISTEPQTIENSQRVRSEPIVFKPTKHELKTQAKQELQERIKQMDKDGTAYCPKCYSTSLSANKRGQRADSAG